MNIHPKRDIINNNKKLSFMIFHIFLHKIKNFYNVALGVMNRYNF